MIRQLIAGLLLMSVMLSGCAQDVNNSIDKTESGSSEEQGKEPAANIEPGTFKKGVFIDTSNYSSNESYKDLLQNLTDNLNAFVQKDKGKFEKGFIDQKSAESNLFLIEDEGVEYQFLGKPVIVEHPDNPERIDVQVNYKTNKDDQEKSLTYNYKKATNGDWKISQID